MATSNYPYNQDTAFNSFTITDPAIVQAGLGRTYSQSELVPVSYPKILEKANTDPSIKAFPLQEFIHLSVTATSIQLQQEGFSAFQSGQLSNAMRNLRAYWKDLLFGNGPSWNWSVPLKCPMLIATPISTLVTEQGGNFHVVLRFNLLIFVTPDSPYA